MPSHRTSRILPYPAEQLFDLAADVERYPEFLRHWLAARIVKRDGDVYYTDQVIALGPLHQRFFSKTVLERPERITVVSDDRLFRTFRLTWEFEPLPAGQCRVALAVDIEFRSRLLRDRFARALARTNERTVVAFEARAHRLLGGASGARPRPVGRTQTDPRRGRLDSSQ